MDLYDILFAMKHGHCGDYYTDLFAANTAGEWKTVSGPIVHITDAKASKVKSLKAQIEPVQDLHGYDSPWPAGGGSNRWDEEWEVGIYNATTGQPESSSGNIRGKNPISVAASTAYYASISDGGTIRILYYDSADTFISSEIKQNAAFTTPSNAAFVRISTINYGLTYNNNIAINYPSTVTTYAPYSNICPISGHTGVNVQKRGKNLFDKNDYGELNAYISGGTIIPSAQHRVIFVPCEPNTTYTIQNPNTTAGRAYLYYTNDTPSINGNVFPSSGATSTLTTGADAKYLCCYAWNANTDQTSYEQVINRLQIELGSTATDYEPYQGETISQEFVDGQGNTLTVYGGESEIVGGKLRVDRAMVDLGTLNYGYNATYKVFSAYKGDIKAHGMCVSSQYKYGDGVSAPDMTCCLGYTGWFVNNIVIKDSRYTDTATFKTAMSGVQLVYELATPQTYHLTPQEVRTLLGHNNIWNDVGNTEVTYRAKKS